MLVTFALIAVAIGFVVLGVTGKAPPPDRELFAEPEPEPQQCTTYVDRFGARHTIHAHPGDGRRCTPMIVPAPPPPVQSDEPDGAA